MNHEQPKRCFSCLETRQLTAEHLISQAIGGKHKAKIYCSYCNSNFGRTIDAELSKTFGHLATLLRVERERGANQPIEVYDTTRDLKLLHDGQKLVRKDPIVKVVRENGKVQLVDITARSKNELERIRRSVTNKFSISEPGQTFQEHHPGPIDTIYESKIDTRSIRRAVTKMAYGFLCTKVATDQILAPSFAQTRAFIKADTGPDLASLNFVDTRWMCDYIRPLHRIHISLNRSNRIVAGYVMLFGIYRFTVLLSNCYESYLESGDLDYTYDPVLQRQVEVATTFLAPPISEAAVLRPRQPKEFVRQEVIRCHKLLEQYVDGYQFLDMEISVSDK